MLFWILTLLTVLAVIVAVLRPLFRQGVGDVADEDHLRVSIYRENLHELDKEYERGQLDDRQLENVKHELELSLLHETGERQGETGQDKKSFVASSDRLVGVVLGILILGGVFLLYHAIGNPQLNDLKQFSDAIAEGTDKQAPPLENMLVALEQHLQKNPEDNNGWLLLANAFASIGEFDKSVNAYAQLYARAGDQPEILLGYVNALVRSNNGSFGGLAAELLQRLLKVDPGNYTALFFSGLAAEEKEDYQLANDYYEKILPILQNNPELLRTVNTLIARNEQLMSGVVSDEEEPAIDNITGSEPASAVTLRVSVSEELLGKYEADDTLFIYARPLEGSQMPLAVLRIQAGELPMAAVLDDSMAMMPAMKLSSFEKVRLQARISKSGNAEPQSGDLSGVIKEVEVADTEPVDLVIDSVLP